jgi:N-acetyltransferase
MSAVAVTPARRVEPVVLEGRHVRLEPLTPAHAPALVEAAGRALPFATRSRAAGRVIGSTRFGNIEFWVWPADSPHARPDGTPDVVEIGWTWLAAEAQRTAVNTEAKLLMLTHAFETWRVRAVKLNTDARNARSRAAIERIGARFDGVLRAHRPASDGGIRDTAAFSLLAEEWPAARAKLHARITEGHHTP